ncbi:MAG TPA: hypothetical protein VHM16_04630 [Rubrobacteraceae bacterium]|nr:hypothetical protein [Rubrobacteraceae bacterium]
MKETLYDISLRDSRKYEDLARRAREADDQELAEFFGRMSAEDNRSAQEAGRLLAQRVAE